MAQIVDEVRSNGFCVFENKLDARTCQELTELAVRIPATKLVPRPPNVRTAVYDAKRPIATRYDFDEPTIFQSTIIQELVVDRSIMAVAQAYLRCQPVEDMNAMWWTVPPIDGPNSEAAQLFHFDMDRFRFIKFFIYLTDVGMENGPHTYIRGSHVRKPRSLSRDGRISDAEMARHYGTDRIVNICGSRGTIFAADTRGFHKGTAPVAGERLVFQFEFANSLFGAPYEVIRVTDEWSPLARAEIARFPYTFQRFQT